MKTRRRSREEGTAATLFSTGGQDDGNENAGLSSEFTVSTGKAKKRKKDLLGQGPESVTPWYTIYTKGDPEYDLYMSTAWGFEKVP